MVEATPKHEAPDRTAAAEKFESDQRAALKKSTEERRKITDEANKRMSSSRPTPTQEELDLAALGVHLREHADDGSGPEPRYVLTRTLEPQAIPGGYQTREAKPAAPAATAHQPPGSPAQHKS